jgi:major membrane immunogen (membrane-anchored lipoprotein)
MAGFKDYVKSKTGAATTKEEMSKLKNDYLKKTSGAAVTESELNNLAKSIGEMGSKSISIPGVSGAAVTEDEMKRFRNSIPKKAKGGEIVIGKGSDYIKDLL